MTDDRVMPGIAMLDVRIEPGHPEMTGVVVRGTGLFLACTGVVVEAMVGRPPELVLRIPMDFVDLSATRRVG